MLEERERRRDNSKYDNNREAVKDERGLDKRGCDMSERGYDKEGVKGQGLG